MDSSQLSTNRAAEGHVSVCRQGGADADVGGPRSI